MVGRVYRAVQGADQCADLNCVGDRGVKRAEPDGGIPPQGDGQRAPTDRAGNAVHHADRIGIPYAGVAADTTDETVLAAEISSFQLETAIRFRPFVSAILNITPDHLDRHGTMENYIRIKESITKNQTDTDVCVLNYEDDNLRSFGDIVGCRVVYFSGQRALKDGVFYEDGAIYSAKAGHREHIVDTKELRILGRHNYENAAAAIAVGEAFDVPVEMIREALLEFEAVEHRIQFICEKNGVAFYNDSKGTNPDAAIKAVEAMEKPVHLIGGGYDKHASYDEWIESFGTKVRTLSLIGETREAIAECAKKHGFNAYTFADSLEEAIRQCYEAAKEGEVVLLSPACASWDMFKSYEERGELFARYARKI